MKNLYNSLDTRYKYPFGAIVENSKIKFTVKIPISDGWEKVQNLVFVLRDDEQQKDLHYNMKHVRREYEKTKTGDKFFYNVFSVKLIPPHAGLFFYYFLLKFCHDDKKDDSDILRKIVRNKIDGKVVCDSAKILYDFEDKLEKNCCLWQLTVFPRSLKEKETLANRVFMQIFVDRFNKSNAAKSNCYEDRILHDSFNEMPEYLPNENGKITNNDYFGGDLQGIMDKLDYLEELGINGIYLSPVSEAHSNHKYNTADYLKIDRWFGDEKTFSMLCSEAKKRKIAIVIDGVYSHSGDDSRYFNKKGRYGKGGAFNDFGCKYRKWYNFSGEFENGYEAWFGIEDVPSFNKENEEYVNFICGEKGVIDFFAKMGISGIRLDVADMLPEELLEKIKETFEQKNNTGCIIGEVWEDATTKSAWGSRRHYFTKPLLDSVMNYVWKNAILSYIRYGNYNEFNQSINSVLENYPKSVLKSLLNSISTHDVERAITKLVGEEIPTDLEKKGVMEFRQWEAKRHNLSLSEYEKGKKLVKLSTLIQFLLPGAPCVYYGDEIGMSGYKDPFNRCPYNWESGDEELRSFFKQVISLRKSFEAFNTANCKLLRCDEDLVILKRWSGDKKIFVVINRSKNKITFDLPKKSGKLKICFKEGDGTNNYLEPYSAIVFSN